MLSISWTEKDIQRWSTYWERLAGVVTGVTVAAGISAGVEVGSDMAAPPRTAADGGGIGSAGAEGLRPSWGLAGS